MTGPAVVQSTSTNGGFGTPGSVTLTTTPTVGNLLIAFVNSDSSPTTFTVSSGWTLFDRSVTDTSGTQTVMGLYRYVQSGDTTALPAFCSAGSGYWSAEAVEVSGVTGSWATDYQGSVAHMNATGSTLDTYTQVTGSPDCLALIGFAKYNASTTASISSGWTLDENGANSGTYGAYGCASQAFPTQASDVQATITLPSSGSDNGFVQVVLGSAAPTTPNQRQSRCLVGSGTPGSFNLGGLPQPGNLLIAFLSWGNGTTVAPSIGTGWTQFDQALNGSDPQMIALYRYVQSGDTRALPAITLTGTAFYAVTVTEVNGVTGSWGTDYVDSKSGRQASGATLTTTIDTTPSADNFGLLGMSNYNGSTEYAAPSGWGEVCSGVNFSDYGSYASFAQFFPTSGSSVSAVVTATASGQPQAYIQVLIGTPGPDTSTAEFSQIGLEAWVTNPRTMDATLIGLEAWVTLPRVMWNTQIGLEVWTTNSTGETVMATTQMGLEAWVIVPHITAQGTIVIIQMF